MLDVELDMIEPFTRSLDSSSVGSEDSKLSVQECFYEIRSSCEFKQAERAKRIDDLPPLYHGPFTASDRQILSKPIETLVKEVHAQTTKPLDILHAYGKAALKAHAKTNRLTEVMISSAEAWAAAEIKTTGPLAGIPVSLKDSIVCKGYDTTVAYSCNVGNHGDHDGTMVRLLKDAGAVPYVKTNLPVTLLSFESANDVWGRCTNPHNARYSPGGSSGGEGALLACGGGRIGIGSDVAGSVRVPAHFSGLHSLKCSTGRWPKMGMVTSMAGQEGVPSVFSPMARTLDDLSYFTASMIGMQPWRYDHSVHPIPWRGDVYRDTLDKKVLKVGVLRTDGVVDPSPACARALNDVAEALRREGHQVIDISPPDLYEALYLGSALLTADGCETFKSFFRTGEWEDAGAKQMSWYMSLPRPVKFIYWAWVKYIRRDHLWAGLLKDWHAKTPFEQWKLVARREAYKAKFHAWWQTEAKLDFLITAPNATPAVPHDGMHDAVSSCGYTFVFNLLDYTAGIIPITHVDRALDMLPPSFNRSKLNGVARGSYKLYDAEAMHGLPVAVQVVGQRLEEEKVLAAMKRVENALDDKTYAPLGIE